MKLAILIYGRLNKCADHYENLLESVGKNNDIDFFMSSDASAEESINNFIKLYNPIAYSNDIIEHNINLAEYCHGWVCEDNMIRHFINKKRAFQLFENYMDATNKKYDYVVSVRIDLFFTSKFVFEEQSAPINTIYIPEGNDYGGINDQVAYGSVDAMKKYSYIFDNLIELLERKLSVVHPESLHKANILYNDIIVKRTPLDYSIIR